MLVKDLKAGLTPTATLAPAARTASADGASLDLQGYEGGIYGLLSSAAGTGTSPTLDGKIQDSADNSTFADVAGLTYTQITGAASHQEMLIDTRAVRRYIRMVATIGGTSPSFACAGYFLGQKKIQ